MRDPTILWSLQSRSQNSCQGRQHWLGIHSSLMPLLAYVCQTHRCSCETCLADFVSYPFYLVSMSGEVKWFYPGGNCVTSRQLQLHCLPVNYRIKFKLSTLTYRALAIHQPPYLASLLHFSNVPRQLRSFTSQQLSIPRTKLNLGKRAFSVAAPIIWNELPTTLKSCESLASFRKNLKTYLFKIAFPP